MKLLEGRNSLRINKLKKVYLFIITLMFCTLASSTSVFAQCDPFLDPFCTEPIPLDGGIVALVAAGAAYGYKKIKNNTNPQKD